MLLSTLMLISQVVVVPFATTTSQNINIPTVESRVPQATTFVLEAEGLSKIELLSFGKNPQSFTIAVKEEDLKVLQQWKTKRSAVIMSCSPTGNVTTWSLTGAVVTNVNNYTSIELIYDSLKSIF